MMAVLISPGCIIQTSLEVYLYTITHHEWYHKRGNSGITRGVVSKLDRTHTHTSTVLHSLDLQCNPVDLISHKLEIFQACEDFLYV